MKTMKTALLLFILMCVVLGIVYPFVITGIVQVFFPYRANGSLIVKNDRIVGSELIGQRFMNYRYFQGRPSSCDYDGGSSSGSNLGPSSERWLDIIVTRILDYAHFNVLSSHGTIPTDLVTASASGLDPHVSIEAAMVQIPRIVQARGIDEASIRLLIMENAERPFFGPHRVNVLKLNLALDNYDKIIKGSNHDE